LGLASIAIGIGLHWHCSSLADTTSASVSYNNTDSDQLVALVL